MRGVKKQLVSEIYDMRSSETIHVVESREQTNPLEKILIPVIHILLTSQRLCIV